MGQARLRITLALATGLATLPALAGTVTVNVSDAIPNGSRVYVALCVDGLDFASCVRSDEKAARATTLQFAFADVSPGRYAVAAFQDLDGNGTLARTQLGLPLEPYAFSNDAGRTRRPTFAAAAVDVGEAGRLFNLRLRSLRQ